MSIGTRDVESELIESVCERVRERVAPEEAAEAEAFVRAYYRRAPADDLRGREPVDLYGAALSHWSFGRGRSPGEVRVRAYNPTFEQHGWQSPHTAIDIVSDDMPFIVDSVSMELSRRETGIHVLVHPVVGDESFMHIEVDRQRDGLDRPRGRDPGRAGAGARRGRGLAADARAHGGAGLRARAAQRRHGPGRRGAGAAGLAVRPPLHVPRLPRVQRSTASCCAASRAPGLGLLRGGSGDVSSAFAKLPPRVRALALEPEPLVLSKANARSTIHRPSYLDYIGVKAFDDEGHVVGERRFLGLFTTAAYREVPANIPVLRRKIDAVVERAGFARGSHDHKALVEVLDTYPRDELFQISADELYEIARGILELGERQRVRLFTRTDRYQRFVSCLVYLPRDRFNTANRTKIGELLREAFGAESVDWGLRLTEWVLVRIHYTLHIQPGELRDFDPAALEEQIVEATRSWDDELQAVLMEEGGEESGTTLHRRYASAFPPAYRDDLHPRFALADIRRMEAMQSEEALDLSLYRPLESPPGTLRCKLYRRDRRVLLSNVLPMFESLGLTVTDERPYKVKPRDGATVWIYDFGLQCAGEVDVDAIRDRFHEGFRRVWDGEAELDGFNGLILGAELDWREVTMLRAVARYLRQVGIPFSDRYMEQTLLGHTDVARALVQLFHARFDPNGDRSRADACVAEIEAAIDAVDSLDEDRILRGFLSVVRAMLRTNYYLDKPYVSFKLDPTQIPLTPLPRPQFEIFVHSPRVEGVHLRGGSVARGGLRWSDRREDFRTEVLGLMKAQMVKNALIVPVGAKGGFVVKRAGDEVVACYTTFISALLDISDTYSPSGEVIPPKGVVRHDGDDPYLVVAADKGTATFSDIANGIAEDYGFWLGDAFASGGSVGYDHKAMGITARSAWVSVQRHFRELGVDVQADAFTVVGIGDMSGDVFGNGMLLSEHIRLVAAFDHRHIFLDPNPDAESSFAERRRLFEKPRSSWADYDTVADLRGRRGLPAHREVDPADRADPRGAGRRRRVADADRADVGDPARARRPAVERRHRDLREGEVRDARRRRRQGQRRAARQRLRAAREGRRRGRQPRLHAARADRVRARRGQGQHRRDRQRRRRQLLRPRGQHQGPARRGRGRGRHDGQAAQRAAGGDDRRGRRARAARLLHADAGALARARAGARDARGARARDARPRGRGPAGPRDRGAARTPR